MEHLNKSQLWDALVKSSAKPNHNLKLMEGDENNGSSESSNQPESQLQPEEIQVESSTAKVTDSEQVKDATPDLPSEPEQQPLPVDSNNPALICIGSPSLELDKPNQPPFSLVNPQPLNSKLFPNQPRPGSHQLPATIDNFEYLLIKYNVTPRYDVIKKKLMINIPGYTGTIDNEDNVVTQVSELL